MDQQIDANTAAALEDLAGMLADGRERPARLGRRSCLLAHREKEEAPGGHADGRD